MSDSPAPLTYKAAGVDIDEGARLVELIAPLAKATARPGSTASLGGFAAAFDLRAAGFVDPVLLTTTDGVGTKLKIAIEANRPQHIGIDLVAMCVNDLLAQGGEPLVFLDYYATGRLQADTAAQVVAGIAQGCQIARCALAGGETAEMPGLYAPGDYDLAGFALGAAERGTLLPRFAAMAAGDVLIGLEASGPHANGYSLIRKIVERSGLGWTDPAPWDPAQDLAAALLVPTRIYVAEVLPLMRAGLVSGGSHITGGGLTENVPRVLPAHLRADIAFDSWTRPPVFDWLQQTGAVPEEDLRRTFNLGIGFVLVASQDHAPMVLTALAGAGVGAAVIGRLVPA
jgi:phosphoribosylaminoimidazole synthetase